MAWRERLTALEDVAAFRTIERNLIAADGQIQRVLVAEMTAAGFRIARVPLLGRSLEDADERTAAGPVVVIGYASSTTSKQIPSARATWKARGTMRRRQAALSTRSLF